MQQKKKNILKKIVKTNYNNELETILENKQFDEHAKSTLLSILYKIESSYNDLEMVKKDVETKDEYISNILNIIKNNCSIIKIIKMTEQTDQIPENKTYVVNKRRGEIIAYPIERKILYAIAKIGKKDIIIKDEYSIINETLSELINVGNSIDMVEPLRDFNGYSWTNIPQEIESIEHNLVYQNLRILVGHKFLNKWVKNDEFIMDYFEQFNEILQERYGENNKTKIVEIISEISVLLCAKYDKTKQKSLLRLKNQIKDDLRKIEDKEAFIEDVTKEKAELSKRLKELDKVSSSKKTLQQEYDRRNENLPLKEKIFSLKILSKMIANEREDILNNIEELNNILKPRNFVEYKKNLEKKEKYLKNLDILCLEENIKKLMIKLQILLLNVMKVNINKCETKQEIEKIICDFRYYMLLPYEENKRIKDEPKLSKQICEIEKEIIDKAIELKLIQRISPEDEINYKIFKSIFRVRIINFEDAYIKVTKQKDKYCVQCPFGDVSQMDIYFPLGTNIDITNRRIFH